jgi:hypothetical protein
LTKCGEDNMEITLTRKIYGPDFVLGQLQYDGESCFILEDKVRPAGIKVDGQTAIPAGRYEVVINMSTRFKKLMPQILNVPAYEGIRLHKGNVVADTEGCPLLGATPVLNGWSMAILYGTSGIAFDPFFEWLKKTLLTDKVFITVTDTYAPVGTV